MNSQHRKRKAAVGILLGSILFLTAVRVAFGPLYYVNHTDSAPQGLYLPKLEAGLSKGGFVIVKLPVDVPALDVSKGFLLLKQVQGLAGDSYEVTKTELSMDGAAYPIQRTAKLPQLQPGSFEIPKGEVLLLNSPADSFDSRYLGPVDQELIVQPVWLAVSWEGW